MCVIGEREAEAKTLSVRTYEDGELGSMSADVVRQRVALAVQDRENIQF
jgi:threonyl-tRNA synthetase